MSQSNSPSHEVRVKHFLSDATDDYLAGVLDNEVLVALAQSYELTEAEASQLLVMVKQLAFTFDVEVTPDADFKKQLYKDLTGKQPSLFERIGNLPPRLQIAGGVALLAMLAVFGRRRFFKEAGPLLQQWRDIQPQGEASAREAKA